VTPFWLGSKVPMVYVARISPGGGAAASEC
jgi:hypothetical protein